MNTKIAILGLAAALCLGSCDQFDLPNPPGQSNPEVPVFNNENLKIEQGPANIDIATSLQEGTNVVLAKVTELVDFPEAYTLQFVAEVADNADFNNAVEMVCPVEGDNVVVGPTELNALIKKDFTLNPEALGVWMRLSPYATLGATNVRLGDDYYGSYEYLVKPMEHSHIIEPMYYLLTAAIPADGQEAAWNVTSAVPFTYTGSAHFYDTPTFMVKFDVPADGLVWAVLPGSSFDAGNLDGLMLGGEDTEALSGTLSTGGKPGKVTVESPYTLSIDMEAMTYFVAFAYEKLYVMEDGTRNIASARTLLTQDYITYTGTAPINTNWYLACQADAKVGSFVVSDGEEPIVNEETGDITGTLLVSNSPSPKFVAPNGLYYVNVNLGNSTYKASLIKEIGLVGAFNGWNQKESVQMSHNTSFSKWTLKDFVQAETGDLKFCCNNDWTLDYGSAEATATEGDLVFKGGNITLEAGTYDVTVSFQTTPPTYTFKKK